MRHIFDPLIALFVTCVYRVRTFYLTNESAEIQRFNANQSTERNISIGNKKIFDFVGNYPNNQIITNKYSFWNFLPKNLFEQFHRIANFYFLVVTLISFFVDTSVTALATLLPLLFVISVTAIKQGYEDWLRYRTDQKANDQPRHVLRNGVLVEIKTSDIEVGDVIKVAKDEDIPCDMVLLSSSEVDGSCYITTVNMDGETNLKIYSSLSETASMTSVDSINQLDATIECEHPTLDLYKFIGRMNINTIHQDQSRSADEPGLIGEAGLIEGLGLIDERLTTSSSQISLSALNLLLRGCAVYTGQETKIFLNTHSQENKVSKIEKKLNTFLIFYIVVLIVASLLWVLWLFLFSFEEEMVKENVWYMKNMEDFTLKVAVREFFVFLVLFNYILPISMYVTIELQKFFGSVFFEWDIDLYDPEMDEHAQANTSDLNEELGQIQYLFTDKTGTLTENLMQFRQLFVDGSYYQEEEGQGLLRIEEQTKEEQSPKEQKTVDIERKLEDMLICLALCHTVRIDHPQDDVDGPRQHSYQSASPDEKALVEACARLGVAYLGSENGKVKLSISRRASNVEMNESINKSEDAENDPPVLTTEMKMFELKHVLEFESCRKRMTVIVEELDQSDEVRIHGRNHDDDDDGCRTDNMLNKGTYNLELSSNSTKTVTSNIHQRDHQEREKGCNNKGCNNKGKQSLKSKSKSYRVICKGAETAVLEGVSSGDVAGVEASVNRFAEMGYRTLVVASKRINESLFKHYDRLLQVARNSLENREEKVTEVYCLIENQFEVLGATAVEDKLQDQVKETIEALRMAEIKVWVLTGDKEETAVNISYSAGHITKDMDVFSLTKQNSPGGCQDCLAVCKEHFENIPKRKRALVIDGKTLSLIVSDTHTSQLLLSLSQDCMAVLCCRLSPIQKAELVRMVKNSKGEPTTAAIGDGANDVNMIREAHVGIGIMGKEGRQATRAADFAIVRFKHLRKVIMVHGHYFYVRLAVLVMYFFYKTLFSSYYLMFYNTTFTALPILLYGIFEKHLSVELLLRKPSLYRHLRNNKLMNAFHFAKWNLIGLWHSFVFFFGTYFVLCDGTPIFQNGWDLGIFDAGAIAMTACVISVNLKLSIESYLFNWIIIAGYFISIFGYYITTVPLCKIIVPMFPESLINHGSLTTLMKSHSAWLVTFLVIVVALLPDFLMRALRNTFHGLYSSPIKWQENKKRMEEDCQFQKVEIELISHKSGLTTSSTLASIDSFHGINDWSHENQQCSSSPTIKTATETSKAQFITFKLANSSKNSINTTNDNINNTNKSPNKIHHECHIPPACDSSNHSSEFD